MVEWTKIEKRRDKKGIVFVLVFVLVFVVIVVVVNELCVCVGLAGMVCVDCGAVVMEEEEDDEGEKRKGLWREMNEEKEEWEMEKEVEIEECASGRRLFGMEKRGKEMMAG
ncbi:uncharacterized protein MONOS_17057 [Monocercomonoides exilis]|uniref:uncharacterized protein n=1 Tax=Monocercomonoides exilis TaxID=2049356 RepID=UPI003559772A|nr:hypothetical protein MONOS_17057 [Monocercomonoides exilis]